MKKLLLITLVLTLAMGIVWVPSVAAVEPIPITIHKTIPAGGPIEDFTFEAWRDLNNNGIIDGDDFLVGQVVITGSGTDVINSTVKGPMIIHEVLIPGSAYEQQPDQIVQVSCEVEVTFNNDVQVQEIGEILILKKDEDGNALFGATFEITPDPRIGTGSLTMVDNGANDELPLDDGILLVTGCLVCVTCNVTETDAPDGYELDPTPQAAHVTTAGETIELTFTNTQETCDLTIYKVDGSGSALAGTTFEITPDPRTGTGSLTVVDNGVNDECAADGVLCLSELICGLDCTVEETVVPDGYVGADPQTVTIDDTLELTFINTPRELSCDTVCAAQTAPGEYLFSAKQANWFTWIHYDKGSGTESDPYEYPIYTGQTTLCGTLYVYDDDTHIFVNYVLTDTDTCTLAGMSEYHLQVDKSFNDLKKAIVKKKNPIPGKCEYKGTFDPVVSETGWIEATEDDISGWTDPIYLFAHGVGCYYCP